MTALSDLKTPWASLLSEEKAAIIKKVRGSRLQIKAPKTKVDKKRREAKSSHLKTLDSMSGDELDILIKRLEERKG